MNIYETRGGALCAPVGRDGQMIKKRELMRMEHKHGNVYCLMQMLPASPQRLEWIRESNLRECKQ